MDPLFDAWLRARAQRRRSVPPSKVEEIDQQLIAACHPKQRAFVLDPAPRFAALTSGRAGKTTGSKVRLVRKAVRIRRARLLFIAPTRDQAEDLIWDALKELLDRLGISFTAHETKLRLRINDTGAIILLVGADDKRTVEKLRGRAWHEVLIDEAATYPPSLLANLIQKIIGPRLGDFAGVLGMVGTPGHVLNGLFYDVTRPRSTIGRDWEERDREEFLGEWMGWSTHRWSLLDAAPHTRIHAQIWEEALREKKRNGWSDNHPIWLREYLGIWAADDGERMYWYRPHVDEHLIKAHPERKLVLGEPWNLWSPKRDEHGWAVLPTTFSDWRHAVGMDMGHGTPFCLQVLAFSPSDRGRNMYHRFEFHQRAMYARKIAELLLGEHLDLDRPGGVLGVIGWPDAMVADLANLGDAIIDELANVYGIRIVAADKRNKPASVELTNGDLLDGRIHVLEGSVLAQQLAELQWRVDDHGMLKEPKHGDDAADGLIYPRREIAKMFEEEKKPDPPSIPRRRDKILEDEKRDFTRKVDDELLASDYYDESAGW